VAKLIGAPPGYLGHRETQPLLSQQKLTSVASQRSGLSIVLFDEIEKAAPSMARLLLGVLDRGVLRLGDNGSVNFEKTIIFMTSNLGAREMMREMTPAFGFQSAGAAPNGDELKQKLQTIGMTAVRRRFSPEFVNRIDHVVTYEPLSAGSLAAITDHEIDRLQRHIDSRLAEKAFTLEVPWETRQWLMEKGTSTEYGARELKRTIHRHVTQHLASMVSRRQITPGCRVRLEVAPEGDRVLFAVRSSGRTPLPTHPVVLLVDDNPELLRFMAHEAALAGWEPVQAKTLAEAKRLQVKHRPHAMVIDLEMSGGLGFDFALLTREGTPGLHIAVTGSAEIEKRLQSDCEALDLDVVAKPFRMSSVLNRLQERLRASRSRI
jgi:CheY-like chemotaxis protein